MKAGLSCLLLIVLALTAITLVRELESALPALLIMAAVAGLLRLIWTISGRC